MTPCCPRAGGNQMITRDADKSKGACIYSNATKRLLLLIATVSGLLLTQCFQKIQPPVAPVWDVQLNLPLIDKTYTLQGLLEKNPSQFRADPGRGGLVIFTDHQSLSSITIGDSLKFTPPSVKISKKIGDFDIQIPDSYTRSVRVRDVFPSIREGYYAVGAMSGSLDGLGLQRVTGFQSVVLDSGELVLKVKNSLPIPMDFPSPIEIRNYDKTLIGTITIPSPIRAGDSTTSSRLDLTGKTLLDSIIVNGTATTPGTQPNEVYVRLDDSVTVTATVKNLKVRHAVTSIPPQVLRSTSTFKFDDSDVGHIIIAELKRGDVTLNVTNKIDLSANVSITFPELQKDGVPLSCCFRMERKQTQASAVSLANYRATPNQNQLSYVVEVQIDDTGDRLAYLSEEDGMYATVDFGTIYARLVIGSIKPTTMEIDRKVKLDVGAIEDVFSGSIRFAEADLCLALQNSTAVPFDIVRAQVVGKSAATGQTASIRVDSTRIQPHGATEIHLDRTQVVDFLNLFSEHLPDEISVSGKVVVNPDGSSGTVVDTDSLSGGLDIEIPLNIALKSGEAKDTSNADLDKDQKKQIDQVNSGTVVIEIENRIPAAVQFSARLLDSTKARPLLLMPLNGTKMNIASAEVGSDGKATLPGKSRIVLELNNVDVQQFKSVKFVESLLAIETPANASTVQFRTSDYLRVRVATTLNYRVDFAGLGD